MNNPLTLPLMKFNAPGERQYFYAAAIGRFVDRSELANPYLRSGGLIPAPEVDFPGLRRAYSAALSGEGAPGLWQSVDDVNSGHNHYRTFEQRRLDEIAEAWCKENGFRYLRSV